LAATQFAVGERVKERISIHGVPLDTPGTIRRVFASLDNLYDVQFDQQANLYAVRGHDLTRADAASQPDRPRTASMGGPAHTQTKGRRA
jgi:hypothetical protein